MKRILTNETTKYLEKKVKVCGWVHSIRSHGKIIFIDLRDGQGFLQIVFTPKNEDVYKIAQKLDQEWVIKVQGKVQKRPKQMINPKMKTGEVELQVDDVEILSEAKEIPPMPVTEKEAEKVSSEKRLDWRWIDLRRPKNQLIFKVWSLVEHSFREYWLKNGYIEIHSPKLMSAASESGSELFEIKYFKGKAFLAQSPQFYKQMAMAAGFEKVFEVGPVFRANPSFTSRHDTEFTSYDMEISFIESHQDVMSAEQEAVAYVLDKVKEKYGEEIEKKYNRKLVVPKIPFPQVTIKEAKQILKKLGIKSEKQGDLNPEEERKLGEYILKEKKHEFVFITEYPKEARPFYHMRFEDRPKITKSFDLLFNGLEITTGAQREHRYDILVKQAKEKKADLKSLRHYFDFFKYGCPPHGGIGFGPSRFLMKIFNVSNVREVTYLYRGVKRLTP